MTTADWYTERFALEHKMAQDEFLRLSLLFKDVCWYNFETIAKNWRAPWPPTEMDSDVELLGMSFTQHWNRGALYEHGTFPAWYRGPIRDAPSMPPQILLSEMLEAKRYMKHCKEQITAAYDWAPGGSKYDMLRRLTMVGKPLKPPLVRQCLLKRKFSRY